MDPIEFFISGTPKPQPRPRAFAKKVGKKFVARVYDAGSAEGWKGDVAIGSMGRIPSSPLDSPLRLYLCFFFPRPEKHFRKSRLGTWLRTNSPLWHTSRPDADNLVKSTTDAMTALGFWLDDSVVCDLRVTKMYGDKPGCSVKIEQIEEKASQ